MESVVGIFSDRATAERVIQEVLASGVPQNSIVYLCGEQGAAKVETLPTTDAERDGMGKTMGAYLGAVTGAGAGLSLGSAAATLLVPGVGPVMAIGIGAAALLGLGGGVAGAAIGDSSERAMDQGVPRDDVSIYHELLRRGHALVIVNTDVHEHAKIARSLFEKHGSEDIEAARRELTEPYSSREQRRAS
jgi:hypothetical protein